MQASLYLPYLGWCEGSCRPALRLIVKELVVFRYLQVVSSGSSDTLCFVTGAIPWEFVALYQVNGSSGSCIDIPPPYPVTWWRLVAGITANQETSL